MVVRSEVHRGARSKVFCYLLVQFPFRRLTRFIRERRYTGDNTMGNEKSFVTKLSEIRAISWKQKIRFRSMKKRIAFGPPRINCVLGRRCGCTFPFLHCRTPLSLHANFQMSTSNGRVWKVVCCVPKNCIRGPKRYGGVLKVWYLPRDVTVALQIVPSRSVLSIEVEYRTIGFCLLPSLVSDVRDTEGHRAVDRLETVALKCSTSAVKKILTEDMDKSVLDSLVEEYE